MSHDPVVPPSSAFWRVLDISLKLNVPLDLDSVLTEVVNVAREVLHADRGSVFLYHPDTDELVANIATGLEEIRVPLTAGIVGECATARTTVNVPDCYADPRFNTAVDEETGYRTHSLLTIPLIGIDQELVGVLQLINKEGGVFTDTDEKIASVLASLCAAALQRAQLLEDHLVRKKQDHDLAVAREIQRDVMPAEMPPLPGYELTGWSQSADQTGGDIFDAFSTSGHQVCLLLADATGHGVGPALSVTQVRAMFRIALLLKADLDQILNTINRQVTEDLSSSRFVTAFLGTLDQPTGTLSYHSAGQAPLLLYRSTTGVFESREATTVPLGITAPLPRSDLGTVCFEPGDIFAVLSDGFFEYPNPAGEFFEEARIQEVIAQNAEGPLEGLLTALREAIQDFAAGTPQPDDMTALLFKRTR